MQQKRKTKYLRFAFLLIFLFFVSLFNWFRTEQAIVLDWSETQVVITDPGQTSQAFTFSTLLSVDLVDRPDFGTCISGGTSSGIRYGEWENDIWGTYHLCAADTQKVIVLRQEDLTYVFSYESDQTTAALYESFCDFLSTATPAETVAQTT